MLFSLSASASQDDRTHFDLNITAPTVAEALNQLSEQTGLMLLFDYDLAKDRPVHPVVGRYTIDEALAVMLAGSGLSGALTRRDVLTISLANGGQTTANKKEMDMGNDTARKSWLGRIGSALAAVVLSGAAHAQPAASAGDVNSLELEEVLVTARRTTENIQQVPMAITALSPEDLQRRNITSPMQLMYAVPSLTTATSYTSFAVRYSLRGLATGVENYFLESPCCIGNASVPFLDIASVQALAGPQGTLFGRSSTAGSVLIEPVRPDLSTYGGSFKVGLGDYGLTEFTGTANIPLIEDRLGVRLAAKSLRRDGYTDVIGSSDKLDEQKSWQGRLGVQFESGRFTNYTAANYIDLDQNPSSQLLATTIPGGVSGIYGLSEGILPFIFSAAYGGLCAAAVPLGAHPDDATCVAERTARFVAMDASLAAETERLSQGDSAKRKVPASYLDSQPSFSKLENWSVVNVAEFGDIDLGRIKVSFKDVFSYESLNTNNAGPIDGVGGRLIMQGGGSDTGGGDAANNTLRGRIVTRMGEPAETFINDLKLDFNLDDGLLVTSIGYYYESSETAKNLRGVGNVAQVLSGIFDLWMGYTAAEDFNLKTGNDERAWYLQSTLDFSEFDTFSVPGLSLTAGYRKSKAEAFARGFTPVLDLENGSFVPGDTVNSTRTTTSDYNYLFTITQQFTPDFMVYLSRTRAFVPGGVNPSIQGQTSLPNASPTFDAEIVQAWELGTKLDFRLADSIPVRLNFAYYRYDYEDIVVFQSAVQDGVAFGFFTNAAAAELNGFEISGAILPVEGLEIGFSYNYNDAKYTEWDASDPLRYIGIGDPRCGPASTPGVNCLIDLTGNPFDRMPEHQGNLNIAYQLPLDESLGQVTLSANVYAQARVWFDATTARQLEVWPNAKGGLSQGSYTTLNLRADWVDVARTGFDAAVFVNNVTDELYALGMTPQLRDLAYSSVTYAPPRMWGIEVSRKF